MRPTRTPSRLDTRAEQRGQGERGGQDGAGHEHVVPGDAKRGPAYRQAGDGEGRGERPELPAVDDAGQPFEQDQQADGHDHRVQRRLALGRADHRPLADRPEHEAGREGADEAGPVAARVVDDDQRDVRGEHRHAALRVVEDPGAPPDQHQGQPDRGVDHPEADPAEGEFEELLHLPPPYNPR
jgi:hypothetical protein